MKKKFGKICLLICSLIIGYTNNVHALDWGTLYGGFDANASEGMGIIYAASYIGGWLRYGALALAVGMLMYKGIKFILSSPEGKAEVQKQMIPWAIGLVILFTFNIVLTIVSNIASDFSKPI